MSNIVNFPNATAHKRWNSISKQDQINILEKVWCVSCAATTKLINADIQVDKEDILIKGVCNKCHGEVARLVEMS